MAKHKASYICNECGEIFSKWSGQCDSCGSWNSITENTSATNYQSKIKNPSKGKTITFAPLNGVSKEAERIDLLNAELNRVLGGGLVKGSVVLIGGDPGIGKSTLLLQSVSSMASNGFECIYISGEESVDQVRLRARRMNIAEAPVKLASATSVADIIRTINNNPKKPDMIIIDSIQTMFLESIESSPGTVTQVRASAHELIHMAKNNGIALILVGHITKSGQIAGPKLLEHMVDSVLYFEGERGHQFRILRAVKNRFGAANEIGVFEMCSNGLEEVHNPSAIFLSERESNVSGSAIYIGMEGSRPIMAEVQALVSGTYMASPRRSVVGWDQNRLAMILAILQTRFGASFADQEVYLNIAGGLKVIEPAVDLVAAASLISSLQDKPLPNGFVLCGELGLSGEIRMVTHLDIRLKEAEKLGFTDAIIPNTKIEKLDSSMTLHPISHIRELSNFF
ncbi:MAG: DNA repair protein RadA [Rickettsiales bacterium]|nr:DNA repair protein RadA [Rickettsiales bacterium]